MSENVSNELTFAFLSEIRKRFIEFYEYDKITSYFAYQLSDFAETMKIYLVFFIRNIV